MLIGGREHHLAPFQPYGTVHLQLQFGHESHSVIGRLKLVDGSLVEVGILFLAIEGTGIVKVRGQQEVVMGVLPCVSHACRERHTGVIVQQVTGVSL